MPAGQAQAVFPVAALAVALRSVQAELTLIQVDYDSPGVGNCISYREGNEQKDKDLLHNEQAQLV